MSSATVPMINCLFERTKLCQQIHELFGFLLCYCFPPHGKHSCYLWTKCLCQKIIFSWHHITPMSPFFQGSEYLACWIKSMPYPWKIQNGPCIFMREENIMAFLYALKWLRQWQACFDSPVTGTQSGKPTIIFNIQCALIGLKITLKHSDSFLFFQKFMFLKNWTHENEKIIGLSIEICVKIL